MNISTNMRIVEKYDSFISDDKRESYIINEADANIATLQYLLNEESNNELAETLESLIKELEEE